MFQAKQKPGDALERMNKQLRTMRDTFNVEYKLPSNLQVLQLTGLDLRSVHESNNPDQTVLKTQPKNQYTLLYLVFLEGQVDVQLKELTVNMNVQRGYLLPSTRRVEVVSTKERILKFTRSIR